MYSSSKWPCIFLILQLRLGARCSEMQEAASTKEGSQGKYAFVVNVCLMAEKRIQLFSGVLISKKRVMTACHPFANITSQDGQVTLPSVDDFRVWAGFSRETGQWRHVVKVHCTNHSVSNFTIMGDDIGVLVVQDEFELPESVSPIGTTEIMKADEMISATNFRTECKAVTWSVKFKAKNTPDLEISHLKECLVETINISSCANFLSAEVGQIPIETLAAGNLMCALSKMTSEGSCSESILPGSPIICSEKILGLVSLTKDPALVDTFPVVLTVINLNTFISLSSLGGTTTNSCYSALISLVLNTFLL